VSVVKQDPGPRKVGRPSKIDWEEVKKAARAEPGEWFMVNEPLSSSVPTQIRLGNYGGSFPDPDNWEFTRRRIPGSEPERVHVYVRYVGPD
jgi:hypothetical protein